MKFRFKTHVLSSALAGASLAVAVTLHPAAAATGRPVSLNGCIVDRSGPIALMSPGPGVTFEADLRLVLSRGWSLLPGDCMSFEAFDYGTDPTVKRQYPSAGWFVEVQSVDTVQDLTPGGDDDT